MKSNKKLYSSKDQKQGNHFYTSRRFYAVAAVSIAIVIFSLSYLLAINSSGITLSQAVFLAQNGKRTLTDDSFNQKNPLALAGEWEFYAYQFLSPDDFRGQGSTENIATNNSESHQPKLAGKQMIMVPGSWREYLRLGSDIESDAEKVTADGYGTYRLLLQVPSGEVYGLQTGTIRAAARIFMNGVEVAHMGIPATTFDDFEANSHYNIGFMPDRDGQLEIIIHVANYKYGQGGILSAPKLDTAAALLKQVQLERTIELMVIIAFLTVTAIFIFIYFARGKQAHHIYFALGSFFMAIYVSTMNHQALRYIIDYNFISRIRIQIAAMLGAAFCFTLFVQHFFATYANHKFKYIFRLIPLLLLTSAFNNPYRKFSLPIELVQLLVMFGVFACYFYIIIIVIRAFKSQHENIEFALPVAVALFTYWLSMFIKIIFEMQLGYLPPLLILMAMIGTILMMFFRLHSEYIEATELISQRLERELQYFSSQISPHFLFNTINTIIALSYEDDNKTRQALNYLAVYFRGKLELHMEKGLISLEDELEMALAYLSMEKLRYGSRLQLELNVEPDLNAQIPPLTLQTLCENAVRHGLNPKKEGGTITLSAQRTANNTITVVIEDNGIGMDEQKLEAIRKGDYKRIGIKNVITKLGLLPGFSIQIDSKPDQGTNIAVIMPEVR